MGFKVDGGEDQAALRAAEKARRAAEAKRAAEARQQAAADAQDRALARARGQKSELSTGRGGALRRESAAKLGARGAPDTGTRTARTPQAVQKELHGVEAALKKKGLNPALRRELQDSRDGLRQEFKQVLSRAIADEQASLPRLPPDQRGDARARIASYQVQLAAAGGAAPAASAVTSQVAAPAKAPRAPEVVKKELDGVEAALKKPNQNPAFRRELQDARQALISELKQSLTTTIAELKKERAHAPRGEQNDMTGQINAYQRELDALQGGGSPSTPVAPSADAPSSTAKVDAAQAQVQQAYQQGGAEAATVALEKQCLGLSQADAAKLLHACGPLIDQVARDVLKGDGKKAQQAITSLSHAAQLAGPEATKEVAGKLAAVITESRNPRYGQMPNLGNYGKGFQAAIDAGASGALALATAQALRDSGKAAAAAAIDKAAVDALNKPLKAYDKAREANSRAEAQLAQDMARFGNGLTDAQRKKYTDAFWADPKNKAVRDQWNQAQATLANEMKANGPALEQAAKAGDKDAGKLLLKGYQALAASPDGAGQSLDFVSRLNHDPALFKALNGDGKLEKHLEDDLLTPAISSAQAKAMETGDVGALMLQLQTLADTGGTLKEIPGEIKGLVETQKKIAQLLKEGKTGQQIMSALHFDSLTEDWGSKSKLGKAVAIATVVFALNDAASSSDGLDRLSASLQAVNGGLEIAAGVLGTLGKASKVSEAAAKRISSMVPYVGLAVDGAQLAEDIRTLTNGGNVGDVVSLVGTGINLVGDIAGIVPVAGWAVDEVLGMIGTVVQGVGSLLSGLINGNEKEAAREKARDAYLKAAGVDDGTRQLLMNGGLVDETALTTMGLTREQFLATLKAQQSLPTNDQGKSAYAAQMSWSLAAAYGLKGDAAMRFVAQMQQKIVAMPWQDLDALDRAIGDLTGLARGASLDGANPGDVQKVLGDDLDLLAYQFQRVAPDVFAQWGFGKKSASDLNVDFFINWDTR